MRRQNLLCYKSATLLKNALSFIGQSVLPTSETVYSFDYDLNWMRLSSNFEPIFHVTKLISAFHVIIHDICDIFFYFRYVPVSTFYIFVADEKIS